MEIIEKTVQEEFSICDVRGYDRGFHVSFVKKEKKHEIILICPDCGERFKLDWNVELG